MIRKAFLTSLLMMFLTMSLSLCAQTTYNSVSGSTLDPSRITFVFGHLINGQPGATELVIQCSLGGGRAELITEADTLNQKTSQFFGVVCEGSGSPVTSYSLAATPLTVTLTMNSQFFPNTPPEPLTLAIKSADWHKTSQYVYRSTVWAGNAEIAY